MGKMRFFDPLEEPLGGGGADMAPAEEEGARMKREKQGRAAEGREVLKARENYATIFGVRKPLIRVRGLSSGFSPLGWLFFSVSAPGGPFFVI